MIRFLIRITVTILFLTLTHEVWSQKLLSDTAQNKWTLNRFSLSPSAGVALFYGDVHNYDLAPVLTNQNEVKFAAGLSLDARINDNLSLQLQYLGGSWAGTKRNYGTYDVLAKKNIYPNGKYFEAKFNEVGVLGEYSLTHLFMPNSYPRLTFHGIFGLSYISYRSILYNLQTDSILKTGGYSADGKTTTAAISTLAIPIGLEAKYNLLPELDINASMVLHNMITNKVDLQDKPSSSFDRFLYVNVGLTYNLGALSAKSNSKLREDANSKKKKKELRDEAGNNKLVTKPSPEANLPKDLAIQQNVVTSPSSKSEFIVEIYITKGTLSGFAVIHEHLPTAFKSFDIETDGSFFSNDTVLTSFIWPTLPEKKALKLSYLVKVDKSASGSYELDGTFSFLNNGTSCDYNFGKILVDVSEEGIKVSQVSNPLPVNLGAKTDNSGKLTTTPIINQTKTNITVPTTSNAQATDIKVVNHPAKDSIPAIVKDKTRVLPSSSETNEKAKPIDKPIATPMVKTPDISVEPTKQIQDKPVQTKQVSVMKDTVVYETVNTEKTLYRVIASVSRYRINVKSIKSNYAINENVVETIDKDWYKYGVQPFETYKDAMTYSNKKNIFGSYVESYKQIVQEEQRVTKKIETFVTVNVDVPTKEPVPSIEAPIVKATEKQDGVPMFTPTTGTNKDGFPLRVFKPVNEDQKAIINKVNDTTPSVNVRPEEKKYVYVPNQYNPNNQTSAIDEELKQIQNNDTIRKQGIAKGKQNAINGKNPIGVQGKTASAKAKALAAKNNKGIIPNKNTDEDTSNRFADTIVIREDHSTDYIIDSKTLNTLDRIDYTQKVAVDSTKKQETIANAEGASTDYVPISIEEVNGKPIDTVKIAELNKEKLASETTELDKLRPVSINTVDHPVTTEPNSIKETAIKPKDTVIDLSSNKLVFENNKVEEPTIKTPITNTTLKTAKTSTSVEDSIKTAELAADAKPHNPQVKPVTTTTTKKAVVQTKKEPKTATKSEPTTKTSESPKVAEEKVEASVQEKLVINIPEPVDVKEATYKLTLKKAELLLSIRDYNSSKDMFMKAFKMKPQDSTPLKRANAINGNLADTRFVEDQYNRYLKLGESAFAAKEFKVAVANLTKALDFKPEASRPFKLLTEIEQSNASKKIDYQNTITKADDANKTGAFANALTLYAHALQLDYKNDYPTSKIKELKSKVSESEYNSSTEVKTGSSVGQQSAKLYLNAIQKAEDAQHNGDFFLAYDQYNRASELNSEEQYPKTKLKTIERIVNDLSQENEQYNNSLKQAQQAVAIKDYKGAVKQLEQAKSIKPEEDLPRLKMIEIRDIVDNPNKPGTINIRNTKKKTQPQQIAMTSVDNKSFANKALSESLTEADIAFKNNDLKKAKPLYEKVLKNDPNSIYAKQQLVLVKRTMDDLREYAYDKLIVDGNEAMDKGNFTFAKDCFTKASSLKPKEATPKSKLKEIESISSKSRSNDNDYDNVINEGNAAVKSNEYKKAKGYFVKASEIKPTDAYVLDQIKKIDNMLNDLREYAYDQSLLDANDALENKNYELAKQQYEIALEAKPEAELPKSKLANLNKAIEQHAAEEKQFSDLIKEGNDGFSGKQYQLAKDAYSKALAIKPQDKYAKDRVAEMDKLIAKNKEVSAQYNEEISKADAAYDKKDFDLALASYQIARSLKKDEAHPKERIEEINSLMKVTNEKYEKEVKAGIEEFNQKDYPTAKSHFEKAVSYKPTEVFATTKLAEIEAILKMTEIVYNSTIKKADSSFKVFDYENAKNLYVKALTYKVDDAYATKKLEETNGMLSKRAEEQPSLIFEQKQKREKLGLISMEAQQAYDKQDYPLAKLKYEEAFKLAPEQTQFKDKVKELDLLIIKLKQDAIDKNYNDKLSAADKAFAHSDLKSAKEGYNEASLVKPYEQYPKIRIQEIDKNISDLKNFAYEAAMNEAIADIDSKEYDKARENLKYALEVKPNDQTANERVSQLDAIVKNESSKEEQYQQTLKEANDALAVKNYENAIKAFERALLLKPNEVSIKQSITNASNSFETEKQNEFLAAKAKEDLKQNDLQKTKTAEEQKQKELLAAKAVEEQKLKEQLAAQDLEVQKQNDYKNAIAEGDKAIADNNLELAAINYDKASKLNPSEQYPKDKLVAVNKTIAEANKINNQFDELVKKGDDQQTNNQLNDAKESYTKALSIKEDPKLQVKIAVINKTIESSIAASYNQFVSAGDKAFEAKNYTDAKKNYKDAENINSTATYPKSQLEEIERIVTVQKEIDDKFTAQIQNADKLFADKEYDKAIEAYKLASTIKPEDKYSSDKITSINAIVLANTAPKEEETYESMLIKGDTAMASKQYDQASIYFKKASALNSKADYPKDRLKEIDNIAIAAAKANPYFIAVKEGDSLADMKDYESAIYSYERAGRHRPNEQYPKEQIQKLKEIINTNKQTDLRYKVAISKADQALLGQNLQVARKYYEEALTVKSKEAYPKKKIAEIEEQLFQKITDEKKDFVTEEEKELAYKSMVEKGNDAFNKEDWITAKEYYEKAKAVLPNMLMPRERLSLLELLIAEKKSIDKANGSAIKKKYAELIVNADSAYNARQFKLAKRRYEEALVLKPEETYPYNRIILLNKLMDGMRRDVTKQTSHEQYMEVINKADKAFMYNHYEEAKKLYLSASKMKPFETYPIKQAKEIDKIMGIEDLQSDTSKEATIEEAIIQDNIKKSDEILNEDEVILIDDVTAQDLKKWVKELEKQSENKTNETPVVENLSTFRVVISASTYKIAMSNFASMKMKEKVYEEEKNGWYIYYVGPFTTYKDAMIYNNLRVIFGSYVEPYKNVKHLPIVNVR